MMFDKNKHKFFMLQILKDIYSDILLANVIGFKGGSALMLFYGLERFSVDLDFNLIEKDQEILVYEKIELILDKYGKIKDKVIKHFGILFVISYKDGERNLKVEISNRMFNDRYEIKNFLGINIKLMRIEDMFAHKFCALLDRNLLTGRDVFDIYFFLKNRTAINKDIVEARMNMALEKYIDECIAVIEKTSAANILNSIGELVDAEQKYFIKNQIKNDLIILLNIFRQNPLIISG